MSNQITITKEEIENDVLVNISLPNPFKLERYSPINEKEEWWRGRQKLSNPKIPMKKGIYFLFNDDELVYIGKTWNIRSRICTHHTNKKTQKEYVYDFNSCTFFLNNEEITITIFEAFYVMMFKPKYNSTRSFSMYRSLLNTLEYGQARTNLGFIPTMTIEAMEEMARKIKGVSNDKIGL